MNSIRAEMYQKIVIRKKPSTAGTMYLRHWGGIGDHMYFLTFVSPLLGEKNDLRRVLAVDVSPRYYGNPMFDLCIANGLIDELWLRTGFGAGPAVYPPEYIEQARNPKPGIELYQPAIHYDKFLMGPGVVEFPVARLRQVMRTNRRHLISVPTRKTLQAQFPQLASRYTTLHPFTFVARGNNTLSNDVVYALRELRRQLVIMVFPTEQKMFSHLNRLGGYPHVTVITVRKVTDALAIQHHADLHIGVESSQLLGAAIQYVPVFYWPSYPNSLSQFETDLGIGDLCYPMSWGASPEKATRQIRRGSMILKKSGAVRCCRQLMGMLEKS